MLGGFALAAAIAWLAWAIAYATGVINAVAAILVAAFDRKDAGAQNVGHGVRHRCGFARIVDRSGLPVGQLQAAAKSMTPPSEVMRPPSNAAVIFLQPTAGIESGSNVSSVMAGVAREMWWQGWLRQSHPTPINR